MARGHRSPSPVRGPRRRDYDDRAHDYQRYRQDSRRDRDRDYNDDRRRDRERDRDRDVDRRDRRQSKPESRPEHERERGTDDDRRRPRDGGDSPRRSASPPSRARSSRPPRRSRSRSQSVAEKDKAKPNFGSSGLLAAATKSVKHTDGTSTVLKYHEPPEARKPSIGWRLYVFKGKEQVDLLHIHRQSAYLIGRDRLVADIPIEHPSCSKQHAVIQFRQVMEKNEFGESKQSVKPFIIDLESTNGTQVNDEQIPAARYFELMPSDVIKFGESAREYVLLHDEAA